MTADVDVTVLLGGVEPTQLLMALQGEGIQARFEFDAAFVRQSRVLPLIHNKQMPVDVVLGSPGLDEYFYERAETLDVSGTTVRVPRREDLICMKLLAGRPQDLQDAESMAKVGPVDFDEVRGFIESMAEALADDSIIAILNAFLVALD
ncbi:hypothetical protein ENSA7_59960 [Enhygromyxa salina]|uniref:DUF6036 domain-containing protein n=2 Tax=Enhygromyxa salina TaxID=215803 RepID=A0A2S9Y5Z0_9BACT|nr:hypothetical protein ENSA7_59960 [Enhygromyxa salina]